MNESTLMVLDQNLGEQMDAIFREDLRYSDEILLDPLSAAVMTSARFGKQREPLHSTQ